MVRILIVSASLILSGCIQVSEPDTLGEPIVVITFDDAHHSIYDRGFAMMQATDSSWHASHFFPTSYPGNAENMTLAQIQEMERAGWENGGHGVTHENFASVPLDTVRAQVAAVDSYFTANHLRLDSWAYAYGNYNDSVEEIVRAKVKNIRTSHDLNYVGDVNRLHLGYFAVRNEHSLNDLIHRVEEARNNGSKLVVIGFHIILDPDEPETPNYFTRTPVFQGFLHYLKQSELPVMSLREAMDKLGKK